MPRSSEGSPIHCSHIDRSACVCAFGRFERGGDRREGFADLLVRGFEGGEVLAVGVVDVMDRRQHRAYERRVREHRIETLLERVALDQAILRAVVAQVGEVGQQEGMAAYAWGEFDDLRALVFGEAQDEIAAHRELGCEAFGAECGRVDAVRPHESRAGWVDRAVDEALDAGAVRDNRVVVEEQREHEFAHRRAADVAGAHEQYLHWVFLSAQCRCIVFYELMRCTSGSFIS